MLLGASPVRCAGDAAGTKQTCSLPVMFTGQREDLGPPLVHLVQGFVYVSRSQVLLKGRDLTLPTFMFPLAGRGSST